MIPIKVTEIIPNDLFNEILVANLYNQNIKDFIKDISLPLSNYFLQGKLGIKVTSGTSYFLDDKKFNFINIRWENLGNENIPTSIEFSLNNTINERRILDFIKLNCKQPFFIITIKDKLITARVYGIILLLLEPCIKEEDYKKAFKLSWALSYLISELFSFKFKTYVENVRAKIYREISITKGFKGKIIFYKILEGIIKLIPFNHSATFYLFNQRENKLYVYAEKNSKANPNYEDDKKKHYGVETFSFSINNFEDLSDTPKTISINEGSPDWLKNILKYKSIPIKNVLLKKIKISLDLETKLKDDTLLGLMILCNYSNSKFIDGDIEMLDFFLGVQKKNQMPSEYYNFFNFISRFRKTFQKLSSSLDLTKINKTNLESLITDLETKIETYLIENMLTIPEGENKKTDKLVAFFTTKLKPCRKFSILPEEVKRYLLSSEFFKEVDDAFYGILNSSKNKILNENLFERRWNTLIAVRIPNSPQIQHLCILREEYFDISYYDRLTIKFISEHIGLALFDFSSVEIFNKTTEYLKEIVKLGTTYLSLTTEKYLEELLTIAIKYTDSKTGNIYTVSGDRQSLELKAQKGEGSRVKKILLSERGVVPYVATKYTEYKDNPFYIEDIEQFIKNSPEIGYIPALKNMHSELVVPLLLGEDLWGILNVESDNISNYDEQKKHIFLNIAQKASEIWQQKQLSYALEKTGEFLEETMNQPASLDEPDTYVSCANQITQLLNITIKSTSAHSATVRFLDDKAENLILRCFAEEGKQSSSETISFKEKPNCIVFTAIGTGEIIDIPDVNNIDRTKYPKVEYYETKEGTKAEYAIPLRYFNRIDGVLNIEGGHAFTENEKFMYRTISRLIELLLIQRTYLIRRQVFDKTATVSLALHKLEQALEFMKGKLNQYHENKCDIENLLLSIEATYKSAIDTT
ncbi:MAG: GAF domain-containing protein, partial [Candidatus Firestonebacteria bacterium]